MYLANGSVETGSVYLRSYVHSNNEATVPLKFSSSYITNVNHTIKCKH